MSWSYSIFFFYFICALTTAEHLHLKTGAISNETEFQFLGIYEDQDQSLSLPKSPRIAYYISNYKTFQRTALVDCITKYYGRLLTIHNEEQDDFIEIKLNSVGMEKEEIMTAGGFNQDSNLWEWFTTAEEIIFENWYDPPPSEGCVIVTGTRSTWGWRGKPCDQEYHFVCEFTLK